ncbi:MAG: 50S ribosomal protein L9 [Planctomycetota bacterium]|jgi:large subunit ribosomal protein L9
MKVLLSQNVLKLGKIGDVVEVKNGYARNYLLPQGMGVEPTDANLKAIEAAKAKYLQELARQRADLEVQAEAIRGKEVTIAAMANPSGHLYGSVGPAQISAALAEENVFVEARHIVLDEPIRQLDKYDVRVELSEDVTATIHVWIVPAHSDEVEDEHAPADQESADAGGPAAEAPAAEAPVAETTDDEAAASEAAGNEE